MHKSRLTKTAATLCTLLAHTACDEMKYMPWKCFVPFVTYSYTLPKSIPKEEIPHKMAKRALKLLDDYPNDYFEFNLGSGEECCQI